MIIYVTSESIISIAALRAMEKSIIGAEMNFPRFSLACSVSIAMGLAGDRNFCADFVFLSFFRSQCELLSFIHHNFGNVAQLLSFTCRNEERKKEILNWIFVLLYNWLLCDLLWTVRWSWESKNLTTIEWTFFSSFSLIYNHWIYGRNHYLFDDRLKWCGRDYSSAVKAAFGPSEINHRAARLWPEAMLELWYQRKEMTFVSVVRSKGDLVSHVHELLLQKSLRKRFLSLSLTVC